jgi:hypothetical protein
LIRNPCLGDQVKKNMVSVTLVTHHIVTAMDRQVIDIRIEVVPKAGLECDWHKNPNILVFKVFLVNSMNRLNFLTFQKS